MERRASVTIASLVLGGSMLPTLVNAQQFPPPLREGTGLVRWSGYVQFRYTGIDNDEDLFALRRLKLMVGGNRSSAPGRGMPPVMRCVMKTARKQNMSIARTWLYRQDSLRLRRSE